MELGSSDEVGSGQKTLGWSWGQVTKLAVDRKHSDGVGVKLRSWQWTENTRMELGSSDEVGSGQKTLGWSWGQVTKLAVDRKHPDGVGVK